MKTKERTMKKIQFKSKFYQIPKGKVQIYGQELLRIKEEVGLTPDNVVEEAKSRKNILHDYFEWDDGKAADAHRKQQARSLINAIEIEVIQDGEKQNLSAFESVVVMRDNKPSTEYRDTFEVISNVALKKQLLDRALGEADYWKKKYAQLKELTPVFSAIDTVKKKNGKRK